MQSCLFLSCFNWIRSILTNVEDRFLPLPLVCKETITRMPSCGYLMSFGQSLANLMVSSRPIIMSVNEYVCL